MKLKSLLILLFTAYFIPTYSQKRSNQNDPLPRPKLVVGIVVDQMRWDYLYRYYERYGSGGFKRMLNEGFSCENTYIDYIPSVTAIGHSTVYTGSVPALHGIAGNDFIIQATGKTMYCTEDPTVETVGSTSKAGQMSPRNLLTSTIADELKLATNFRSKVVGIALKDRGGILPAGHSADAAYWYDDLTGNWITSTYYMKDLPAWVKNFNGQKQPANYLTQQWTTLYPIDTYAQSTADNVPYEGPFKGETTPTFPHNLPAIKGTSFGLLRNTPFANTLTFDFAKASIEAEGLGADNITDFLAVSLSTPDYLGHQFGPNSIEVEDNYLRLDHDFAAFFSYLDKKVGKGNYTVFLSADHAAAHNPSFLTDNKIPAGLWPSGQHLKELNKVLEGKYNAQGIVLSFSNYQVTFNNNLIKTNKLNEEAIKEDCIEFLKTVEGVAFVVDQKEAANANIPDGLKSRIINGYNVERSGVIQIVLKPGWYSGTSKTGTTHGSWNPYDTHIPLVWMGWGINQGKSNKPANMTDIAPTLAALLRIQEPNGNIGKPIVEVLK
jgi:predicted AlkP superfamily pyrophosphatase or phosphodiesterase